MAPKSKQIVPNLPIGVDDCSEIDSEWKSVSFATNNKAHRYYGYNDPSTHEPENYSCPQKSFIESFSNKNLFLQGF